MVRTNLTTTAVVLCVLAAALAFPGCGSKQDSQAQAQPTATLSPVQQQELTAMQKMRAGEGAMEAKLHGSAAAKTQ
jgi:hypothetical protein